MWMALGVKGGFAAVVLAVFFYEILVRIYQALQRIAVALERKQP